MTEERPAATFKRVLVALDASPSSAEALEAAAQMAARFHAELLGLFIEDVNLLRFAALPSSREVGHLTGTFRELDVLDMERHLRVQARRMQRLLDQEAERYHISVRFDVARGSLVAELLAAASGADVLFLHGASWGVGGSQRLGPEVRLILGQATGPVMVVRRSPCVSPPLLAVYDGSAPSRDALMAAAALAEEDRSVLSVLLADSGEQDRLREEVTSLLGDECPQLAYRLLSSAGTERLVSRIRRVGCGTLVLPVTSDLVENEALLSLVEDVDVSVLLVR